MAKNKIIYDNTVLLDLSEDTVSDASHIMSGYVGHLRDGTQVTGTGSGGSATIGTATTTNSSASNTSISFSVDGEPIMFSLVNTGNIALSSGYYYISSVVYDGSGCIGSYGYYKSGGGGSRYVYADNSHYSFTYSSGTLTVSSSASRSSAGGAFYSTTYKLTYVY